jgi:hypothetical protein
MNTPTIPINRPQSSFHPIEVEFEERQYGISPNKARAFIMSDDWFFGDCLVYEDCTILTPYTASI